MHLCSQGVVKSTAGLCEAVQPRVLELTQREGAVPLS